MEKQTVDLQQELDQFTGTENYYPHWTKALVYTDGVKYLAAKAGAFWLIDLVSSYQGYKKFKEQPFQVWELKVKDSVGVVTCTDGNDNKVGSQKIPYTDFPLESVKLFLIDGVLLLTSEY